MRTYIKNEHIKHFLDNDERYLCIKVVNPTRQKIAKSVAAVTCSNCKKILKKRLGWRYIFKRIL